MKRQKIAIISDQICGGIGGAESILFKAIDLYPDAPVYTTIYNPEIIPEKYKNTNFRTSFIQKLPIAKKYYKIYFPLMPLSLELLNLQEYDILFSSHHSVAKGIIPRPDAVHICYCHSPARYIWDLFWTYSKLNNFNPVKKFLVAAICQYLRIWDVVTANRVDLFLANSNYTAARIKKFWNKNSIVLFPPVDTEKFNHEGTEDYYLMAGRLVSYKGYDLAVDAFNESGKKLVIIGDGTEYKKLKKKANRNVQILGNVSDEVLVKHMNNCKGFVFPGQEDFGIVMAEAQAAGKPVIAFNKGGACDIVINNETGILFEEQTVESLNEAINKAESRDWDHKKISENSKRFDKKTFSAKLKYIIENAHIFKQENSIVLDKDARNISELLSKCSEEINNAGVEQIKN